MLRIIGDTNIDFIGMRKKAFILSALFLIVGLGAFTMIILNKANMGIDFAGGTMIQGNFEQPISIGSLRDAVIGSGFTDASIQALERHNVPNSFIVRVKETKVDDMDAAERLLQIINESFAGNTFHLDSEHIIGPAVGESLKRDAQWAVFISVLGMIIYIGLRFDFRSGVAATIATFHDVLVVLGILLILDKELTLLVVTALLTLAGYSLTDTVVVYDRIRENLKKFRGKGQFVGTVNKSINEVLSRTIMTSLTSLTVVVIILIFGGEVLRDFALALTIGIVVGTYSSVFVASPVIVEWEARSPKRFK